MGGYHDPESDPLSDPLLPPGERQELLAKRRELDRLLTEQFTKDLLWQLDTEVGRRFCYTLLSWTQPLEDCGTPGGEPAALAEGKARIGRRLLKNILRHAPEGYRQMMKEADELNRRTSAAIRNDPKRG